MRFEEIIPNFYPLFYSNDLPFILPGRKVIPKIATIILKQIMINWMVSLYGTKIIMYNLHMERRRNYSQNSHSLFSSKSM